MNILKFSQIESISESTVTENKRKFVQLIENDAVDHNYSPQESKRTKFLSILSAGETVHTEDKSLDQDVEVTIEDQEDTAEVFDLVYIKNLSIIIMIIIS